MDRLPEFMRGAFRYHRDFVAVGGREPGSGKAGANDGEQEFFHGAGETRSDADTISAAYGKNSFPGRRNAIIQISRRALRATDGSVPTRDHFYSAPRNGEKFRLRAPRAPAALRPTPDLGRDGVREVVSRAATNIPDARHRQFFPRSSVVAHAVRADFPVRRKIGGAGRN